MILATNAQIVNGLIQWGLILVVIATLLAVAYHVAQNIWRQHNVLVIVAIICGIIALIGWLVSLVVK